MNISEKVVHSNAGPQLFGSYLTDMHMTNMQPTQEWQQWPWEISNTGKAKHEVNQHSDINIRLPHNNATDPYLTTKCVQF
jgi:hypothetical protein